MLEKLNLQEILKKNPSIRREDLADIKSLTEELRKLGTQRRGYRLALPFARHRAKAGEENGPDPRTKNLTGSRF
jgi:hypothetical protein